MVIITKKSFVEKNVDGKRIYKSHQQSISGTIKSPPSTFVYRVGSHETIPESTG